MYAHGKLVTLAIIALLLAGVPAMGANLVLNPGFEDYTNSDPGDAAIWTNSDYPTHQTRSNAHSLGGDYSLKIFSSALGDGSTDIRQDVYINNISPSIWGKPYEFSLFVLNPSDEPLSSSYFRVLLRPRKADSTILETLTTSTVNASTPTDQWTELTLSGTVPQDTQRFLIQLAGSGLQSSSAQAVYLDNFSFQVVPEPSTFMLTALGLFGLGFVRRRRRK